MVVFKKVSLIFASCALLSIFKQLSSLQITNFFVPKEATHQANIDCKYKIAEGEKFYDVKWYKDDEHFYTCAADGTVQEYPVEGVKTYHSSSSFMGSCPVSLVALTSKSNGEYKCEVNLDGPLFSTAAESKYMTMIMPSAQRDDRQDENHGRLEQMTFSTEGSVNSGKKSTEVSLFLFILVYRIL